MVLSMGVSGVGLPHADVKQNQARRVYPICISRWEGPKIDAACMSIMQAVLLLLSYRLSLAVGHSIG